MDRIGIWPRSDGSIEARTNTLRAIWAGFGVAGWLTAALMAVQMSNLADEKRDISIELIHSKIAQASVARQIEGLMAARGTSEARSAGLED